MLLVILLVLVQWLSKFHVLLSLNLFSRNFDTNNNNNNDDDDDDNDDNNDDNNNNRDDILPIYEESVMATAAVGRLGLKVLACIASFVYSHGNNDDNYWWYW